MCSCCFFILVGCGKLSVLSVERHCPWMWKVVLIGYRDVPAEG